MTWEGRFLSEIPPDQRPRKSRIRDYGPLVAKMRKSPWEWMILREDAPRAMITQLRAGKYKAFRPTSDWEFKLVGEGPRVVLFAHFIGAPKPPDYEEWPKP